MDDKKYSGQAEVEKGISQWNVNVKASNGEQVFVLDVCYDLWWFMVRSPIFLGVINAELLYIGRRCRCRKWRAHIIPTPRTKSVVEFVVCTVVGMDNRYPTDGSFNQKKCSHFHINRRIIPNTSPSIILTLMKGES